MGGGFVAAAGQVEVGDAVGSQHTEAVESLGREVDVPFGGKRRSRDEKHVLRGDEFCELRGDGVVHFAHDVLRCPFDVCGIVDAADCSTRAA